MPCRSMSLSLPLCDRRAENDALVLPLRQVAYEGSTRGLFCSTIVRTASRRLSLIPKVDDTVLRVSPSVQLDPRARGADQARRIHALEGVLPGDQPHYP
jgi:hypothetical protein